MLQRLARERRRWLAVSLRNGALLLCVGLGAALSGSMAVATAAPTPDTKTKSPVPAPAKTSAPAAGTSTAKASAAKPSAGKPASAPALPAGFEQMSQLTFLTGAWIGHLQAMPIFMDISINGTAPEVGGPIKFKIKATPPANAIMKFGLEGDYNAVAAYSATQQAVRAVVTDVSGHGVEMLGSPEGKPTEWLFNSTAQGAPFPFKVRVRSVSTDQIVVNYSSGGRLPLTYEVTFNRVDG